MVRHWGASNFTRANARGLKSKGIAKKHTVFNLTKLLEFKPTSGHSNNGFRPPAVMYIGGSDRYNLTTHAGTKKFMEMNENEQKSSTTYFEVDPNDENTNTFEGTDLFGLDGEFDRTAHTRNTRFENPHQIVGNKIRNPLVEGGGLTFEALMDDNGLHIDVTIMAMYGWDNQNTDSRAIYPEASMIIRAGRNGKQYTNRMWKTKLPAQLKELGFDESWVDTIFAHLTGLVDDDHECDNDYYDTENSDYHVEEQHNATTGRGATPRKGFQKSIDPACNEKVASAIKEFIAQCKDNPSQDFNPTGMKVQSIVGELDIGRMANYSSDDDQDYYRKVQPALEKLRKRMIDEVKIIWEDNIEEIFDEAVGAANAFRKEHADTKPARDAARDIEKARIKAFQDIRDAEMEAARAKFAKSTEPHNSIISDLDNENRRTLDATEEQLRILEKAIAKLKEEYPARRNR